MPPADTELAASLPAAWDSAGTVWSCASAECEERGAAGPKGEGEVPPSVLLRRIWDAWEKEEDRELRAAAGDAGKPCEAAGNGACPAGAPKGRGEPGKGAGAGASAAAVTRLLAEGQHAQPNVQLDALVSAFSAGPVGIGDGDGHTDAALALATCRADGVLLPPSKLLTPLDNRGK